MGEYFERQDELAFGKFSYLKARHKKESDYQIWQEG